MGSQAHTVQRDCTGRDSHPGRQPAPAPRIDGNEDSADRRRLDNPTRRLGTGEDIGNMAAFILAPGNTWLNGQTITLDGGDALANGAYFTEYQAWDDADWARARQMAKAANQPNVNDGEQEATPT